MPITPAHSVLVLGLKKRAPQYLSLTGLIVGAMVPDLSYFYPLPFFVGSGVHYLHSVRGALAFGMPAGFLICCFAFWIRRTAVELLGRRERHALRPIARLPLRFSLRDVGLLFISVLIGEVSHIFWDSFTHRYGWFVKTFPILQRGLWWPDSSIYNFLQHVSDVFGLTLLAFFWLRWRRRQPVPLQELNGSGHRWRLFFWLMQFTVACFFAASFVDRRELFSLTLIDWEVVLMPITIHFGAALLSTLALSLVVLKLSGIGSDLKT